MTEPNVQHPAEPWPPGSWEEPYRYNDDQRRTSFDVEDERWRSPWRDWLLLAGMIALSLTYHLVIFALQPGLR